MSLKQIKSGIEISKSAQQRLIHRQEFELPQAETPVAELSVDGGNIRVRTPKGEVCSWKGYTLAGDRLWLLK